MDIKRIVFYSAFAALTASGIFYYRTYVNPAAKSDFERKIKTRRIIDVLDDDSDTLKLNNCLDGKTVIEFSMNSCRFCEYLEPDLEKSLEKHSNVKGFYFNKDTDKKISDYLIRNGIINNLPIAYPTTLFIENRQMVGSFVGSTDDNLSRIEQELKKFK